MNESTLHPNLAKLAAAYDEILTRHNRGEINTVTARAHIAQLEARDDEGVRWNIDPDTGEWVRKTALGDFEYDAAPPTHGYMTADAFDYSADPRGFNPAHQIQLAQVNGELEQPPHSLAGATQRLPQPASAPRLRAILDALPALGGRTKAAALAGAVLVLSLVFHACSGPQDAPTPTPKVTSGAPHAVKKPVHLVPRLPVRAHHR